MTDQSIDLVKVFSQVAKTLASNQQSLNDLDSYNHDHGDHMVETFNTISKAMKTKKGSAPSEMLNYAAQQLSQTANNGSAQLYSQGLQKAAQQFQGQNVDAQSAITLLQTLMGGGQAAPQPTSSAQSGAGGVVDLLGSLLGGQPQAQSAQSQPAAGGDLLGSLLGTLTGSPKPQSGGGLSDGLDVGDLVTAGMAFFQAKQQGKTGMNALVDAFVAASGMGNDPHRQESTQLVVSTFMNALGKMGKK